MRNTLNVRRLTTAALFGLLILIAARGVFEASLYPVRRTEDLRRQLSAARDLPLATRLQLETDLLQYETDNRVKIWTAIVQAAGGVALLLGLFFTARNLRATQDKLDIDRQGQLTNRFIQATAQLGAELKGGQPNVEVRLGGIYALKRIANDWPRDYWPIADVLTAYVRHNAPWNDESASSKESKPRTDIQAVLTVLGRNDPPEAFNDRNKFDLRETDLRGAEFWDARLAWTDFWGAHLEGAKFWGADLRNAKLNHAHLTEANLRGAKLEGATLDEAVLTGAVFDADTVWPRGFEPGKRGAVLVPESP